MLLIIIGPVTITVRHSKILRGADKVLHLTASLEPMNVIFVTKTMRLELFQPSLKYCFSSVANKEVVGLGGGCIPEVCDIKIRSLKYQILGVLQL